MYTINTFKYINLFNTVYLSFTVICSNFKHFKTCTKCYSKEKKIYIYINIHIYIHLFKIPQKQ